MQTSMRIRKRTLLCVAVLALLPIASLAQQPEGPTTNGVQPPAGAAPSPPPSSLTTTELQLQLVRVQDATNLSDDAKAKAVGLYTQAIQQAEIAQQWATKSSEFEAERDKAPAKLEAIQLELSTPLAATPELPADAARSDLETRLRQLQSDLDTEKKTLADWERERDQRTTRRKEIPDLLTAAKSRLQSITDAPTGAEDDQSPAVRSAQRALNQARRLAVEREIEAYNSELLSYDARRDLLQARLDRSARRVNHVEKLYAALQKRVQDKARQESEQALREARKQLDQAHPAIRPLAEEREQLALEAKSLQAESKQVDARVAETDALLTHLNQEFDKITRRVNATGLTNAIGQLLRKHRGNLPSLRLFERDLRQGKDRISAVQLSMMGYEDRRAELLDPDSLVAEIMATVDADTSKDQRAKIKEAAEAAINNLRTDTDNLLKDYDRLFDKLVDLDSKERDLLATITRFGEYVDEKVLWIKSGSAPNLSDIRFANEAVSWLLSPNRWGNVLGSVVGTFQASPSRTILGLLAIMATWSVSPRMRRTVREAGEAVSKPTRDTMRKTMLALFATAVLALRWPISLWFTSWVIASANDATDFSKAVGSGLDAVAVIVLTLQSIRQLARINGLAEKHFRWNARSLSHIKRHIAWLTPLLVPTFFVFATMEAQAVETAKGSLGRMAFVVAFLGIAWFVHRVLHPTGPLTTTHAGRQLSTTGPRLIHIRYFVILAVPLCLVVAAIAGYYYTAIYLGTRFIASVWLLVGLIVLFALVKRWLLLQIRHRAIREARERAEQRRLQKQKENVSLPPVEAEAIAIPEDRLDVASINKQTLQLLRVTLLAVGVAGLWVIWAEALPALRVLNDVTVWSITHQVSESVVTAEGEATVREYAKIVPITLANLGLVGLAILVTVVAVKNVPGFLEITILQRLPIDAGGRFTATAITRYIIIVAGTIVAFGQIGVGWSQVQWLVAAMTVGLGFGLQEIFANLASGLLLLIERPIRIGDTVTVAETHGTVTRIRTRATTIVGWDRKELVIPNREFITGRVVNWTLSDSNIRVIIPVGIAYGSDTKLAREVLTRIAHENANVLAEPAARILFIGFGDSSLNFEVRAFVGTIDHYWSTIDEIHNAVDQEFRKAGVEIAFPQRDIHVRSIRAPLRMEDTPLQHDPPIGPDGSDES